ncbi:uncharacterized protein N7483_007365 [Penicillium malachiteum]|uniref:uncharacterized protein n=1 Tax=Penicillium malachiteum TaxID=1324776 RepID=UPI002548FE35|nr:uncharacterized protein N7483_007365 [Penicillium malachiteum]KAJ5726008.1 hypothetical protein N7483_007365 [Penicillium malachiteum]
MGIDESIGLEGKDVQMEQTTSTASDEVSYPTGIPLWSILISLTVVIFLVSMDGTIITTAITRITDEFDSTADIGWYGSAYKLTICAFQLAYGNIFKLFPVKWVFLSALTLFELGCVISAVAQHSYVFIIGRALSGLGAAGVLTGWVILTRLALPLEKRPLVTGIVGSMEGVAIVIAPLLGGVFTSRLSWRWCFYINIILGAPTGIAIILFFPKSTSANKSSSVAPPDRKMTLAGASKKFFTKFDILGLMSILPAIFCTLLALEWGGSSYNWANSRIIALFVLGGVFFIIWGMLQFYQGDKATVPVRIIKQRSVACCVLYSFGISGTLNLFEYYTVKGVSAIKAGYMSLPLTGGLIISSIATGFALSRLGYYTPFMMAGGVLMILGVSLMTTLKPASGISEWAPFELLIGLAAGIGFQQPLIAIQAILPDAGDAALGTAIVIFTQSFSSSIFLSVGNTIFSNGIIRGIRSANLTTSSDDVDVSASGLNGLVALLGPSTNQTVQLAKMILNSAVRDVFYLALGTACLLMVGALGVEWKSVKRKSDPETHDQRHKSSSES